MGRLYLRAMAIGAFNRRRLIKQNGFAIENFRFPMTFVTSNICMSAGKSKVGPGVVIEGGRNPALNVVAAGAASFAVFHKLSSMNVRVAVLADLRRSFELDLTGARQGFVACAAGYGAMSAQERELCFRMIETVYIRP